MGAQVDVSSASRKLTPYPKAVGVSCACVAAGFRALRRKPGIFGGFPFLLSAISAPLR